MHTILLMIFLVFVGGDDVDWCSVPFCHPGKHTRCQYATASPKCLATPRDLSSAEQWRILDLHNVLRAKLAEGRLDGFSRALDMETMQWDTELQGTAQKWAEQCAFGHDECRHSPRFSVGQNVAVTGGTIFSSDLERKVMMWWNEYEDYPYHDGRFYFSMRTGHFTQMAWAKSKYLGCGRTAYVEGQFNLEYLVCNYGPAGNVEGDNMYTAGAQCGRVGLAVLFVGLSAVVLAPTR